MPARRTLLAAVAAIALMAFAAQAGAVDATATFDDRQAGTSISTQYAGLGGTNRGVVFGPQAPGQGGATAGLPVVATATGLAASGTQIGQVSRRCVVPLECVGPVETWGRFASPRSRIRVSVGAFGTVQNTVTLTAFDASGVAVAPAVSATVTGGTGFRTPLQVTTSTPRITFFRVRGSTIGPIGVDSVLFDIGSTAPAPDFTIASGGASTVTAGSSATVAVTITRLNNSNGAIRLAADPATLPRGVTVVTRDATLLAGGRETLSVRAATDATLVGGANIRITATPLVASAGPAAKSVLVPLSVVAAAYDAQITSIEVSQGIQVERLPVRNLASPGTPVPYAGVKLVRGGRTVVRVYASNARTQPATLTGATVQLFGFDSAGRPLPGSPRLPEHVKPLTFTSLGAVDRVRERLAPGGAFTFTLPPEWTGTASTQNGSDVSTILEARLVLPPATTNQFECAGCQVNNGFRLTGVNYLNVPAVPLHVVRAIVTGFTNPTRSPQTIFADISNLTPFGLMVPAAPETDVNLTDDYNAPMTLPPELSKGACCTGDEQAEAALVWLVGEGLTGVVIAIAPDGVASGYGVAGHAAVNDLTTRPRSGTGHEAWHALGRIHAGRACEPLAEFWPPDDRGYIHGVGLDRRPGSGFGLGGPYRIVDPQGAPPFDEPTLPSAADRGRVFDAMSYCGPIASNDVAFWTSVEGWNQMVDRWRSGPGVAAPLERVEGAREQQAAGEVLRVRGLVEPPDGARILSVRTVPPSPQPPASARFRLVVRDGAGAVLADVAMGEVTSQSEGGPTHTVLDGQAALPAAAVAARVEIVRGGTVVASRVRSASAPVVAVTSPASGARIPPGTPVEIGWTASDADGDALAIRVEYSASGGRRWRTTYTGPNTGRATLPADYFWAGDEALLRVTADDGFNATSGQSAVFRATGRAPRVRIASPARGQRIAHGATLLLSGSGDEDNFAPLAGDGLVWFDGRRRIATGAEASVSGLQPGRHTIRLVGRDRIGRTGQARTTVTVTPVTPAFLRLIAPRRISPRARSLTLLVAATVPSRLTVGADRRVLTTASVGTTLTRVRVPVSGSGPLRLRLTLRSGARPAVADLLVRR